MLCTRVSPFNTESQNAKRRLPAHPDAIMITSNILDCYRYQRRFYILVIGLILNQSEGQTQQPVKCCPDYFPSIERIGMDRSFSPLLRPGTEVIVKP
jgi:hypothetical protein